MEGAKISRLQLYGFSLLSQIFVIPITHARPIEIDLKHQCGDGRISGQTSEKSQSLVPLRSASPFASTSCCPSRRRRAPRIKKKRARK